MLLTTMIEEAEVESRDELATLLAGREVRSVRHGPSQSTDDDDDDSTFYWRNAFY